MAAFALCSSAHATIPPAVPVFFDTGSAVIDSHAYEGLDTVVRMYKAGFIEKVAIEGHADRVGTAEANLDLSRRRAVSVRDYLVSHGVAPAAIMCGKWYGEARPVTPTADGVAERNNRRALVVWGWAFPSDCEFVHQPF